MLRAMTFFDDAEADPLLPEGLSPAEWTEIKGWYTTQVPVVLRRFI